VNVRALSNLALLTLTWIARKRYILHLASYRSLLAIPDGPTKLGHITCTELTQRYSISKLLLSPSPSTIIDSEEYGVHQDNSFLYLSMGRHVELVEWSSSVFPDIPHCQAESLGRAAL